MNCSEISPVFHNLFKKYIFSNRLECFYRFHNYFVIFDWRGGGGGLLSQLIAFTCSPNYPKKVDLVAILLSISRIKCSLISLWAYICIASWCIINHLLHHDMHMVLFRVRDGFISAQVSKIFHEPLGEWKIGDECWDNSPSRTRNNVICIFSHDFRCFVHF